MMNVRKAIKCLLGIIVAVLLLFLGYNIFYVKIGNERVFRFTDEYHTNLNCTDADLENVKHLIKLEHLFINSPNVTNIDFVYDFSNIQTLYISASNTNMDLSSISQCQNLETFYMFNAKLENIRFLCQNAKLKNLNLGLSNVTNISGIAQVENLESVTLCNATSNSILGMNELNQLCNLISLTIVNATSADIDIIKECKNLRSLSLIDSRESVDLKKLSDMEHLETLYIPDSNLENVGLLSEFTALKEVSISENAINYETKTALQRSGITVTIIS